MSTLKVTRVDESANVELTTQKSHRSILIPWAFYKAIVNAAQSRLINPGPCNCLSPECDLEMGLGLKSGEYIYVD